MGHPAPFVTPPSAPPIYQTTAFDVPDLYVLEQLCDGQLNGHTYTRDSNPNHSALADSLAAMEGAGAGAVFSSGMGAIAAIIISMVNSGDHLLMSGSLYGQTLQLMGRLQQQFNVEVTQTRITDPDRVARDVRTETKLCLAETISNPMLEVADIAKLSSVLGDVPLIVDNTFTTPELIRPLEHGAHAVVHSASKYLNGHGDVMLGVAAGTPQLMSSAIETASLFGQNANPFESWLTQRGLRTLSVRMKQICETTRGLATFLREQNGIRRVRYPMFEDHASHQAAMRLYPQGAGGIITIDLDTDGVAGVSRFMRAIPELPFSPTLADARTTVSHPASTSNRFMTDAERSAAGITPQTIRISVGLEGLEQLQDDFARGLAAVYSDAAVTEPSTGVTSHATTRRKH